MNRLLRLVSPKVLYDFLSTTQPYISVLCVVSVMASLILSLLIAPADYQQGDVFRIMYVHVPCAIISMLNYTAMAIAALFFLIWRVSVADVVVQSCAAVGVAFTALALITGSIWGKPTWGTWWIWDARLTSELVLGFMYVGIIAMRRAIPVRALSARMTAVMVLIGVINLPIIHYSVNWWHTLHQGATLFQFAKPTISESMLIPLLVSLFAGICVYSWLVITLCRIKLLQLYNNTSWVRLATEGACELS